MGLLVLGVIISIAGIVSIVNGVNLNNSLAHQFQSIFSSGTTDPGTTYIVFGVIGLIIGVIMIIVGITKKNETGNNIFSNIGTSKMCPFCANDIKMEAIICQFCGKNLPNGNIETKNENLIHKGENIINNDKTWICVKCGEKNIKTTSNMTPKCNKCGEYKA